MFIDIDGLNKLFNPSLFSQFVDRVFSNGAFFSNLDYPFFSSLLNDPLETGKEGEAKLADGIVPMDAERMGLYKAVRANEREVAYAFEPPAFERTIPKYGPPDERGEPTVIGETVKFVPTHLSFDEFVAAMWLKGVRFGLMESEIRAAIAAVSAPGARVTLTKVIAKPLAPGESTNAAVFEASETFRKDNRPRMSGIGKVDLKARNVVFPQTSEGEVIFKKIPSKKGKNGRKITNEPIESETPKDFDFSKLSGPGTRVERDSDGNWVIVAARKGFVCFEPLRAGGLRDMEVVSVTENPTYKGEIGMKTTGGDIPVDADVFVVEDGLLHERTLLEVNGLDFTGYVHGVVRSVRGNVKITGNLVGSGSATESDRNGSITCLAGNVDVTGLVSDARIVAKNGTVTVNKGGSVRNSVIIAKNVVIAENAVRCHIAASESVTIGISEGCGIIAKSVKIGVATASKDSATAVVIEIPDLSARIEELGKVGAVIASLDSRLESNDNMIADMDVRKNELFDDPKFHAKAIEFKKSPKSPRPKELAEYQRIVQDRQRLISENEKIKGLLTLEKNKLSNLQKDVEREINDALPQARTARCEIDRIYDPMRVRKRRITSETKPGPTLSDAELRAECQAA